MTAQKGKDLLLKVDTDGAGSFVTVAGLRARTLAFNAATVDVTDTESDPWADHGAFDHRALGRGRYDPHRADCRIARDLRRVGSCRARRQG